MIGVEERLRRLEDREAIRDLLTDYGRALDRRDTQAYSELFATDGEWSGGLGSGQTPAGIKQMLDDAFARMTPGVYRNPHHLLGNFAIDLDGDRATATSRWVWIAAGPDGAPQLMRAGRYDDDLVREEGRWKFRRRRAVTDLLPTGG